MKVIDCMARDVVTLQKSDHMDLAHDIMQLGRIRHMPVLDDRRLVGILSQRDLFRAALSSVLHLTPTDERKWLAKLKVEQVMTRPVITIGPQETVRRALAVMIERRIGCLPVVEADKLVGLLSESDCLHYLARILEEGETG